MPLARSHDQRRPESAMAMSFRFLGSFAMSLALLLVTRNVVTAAGLEPSKPSQTVLLEPGGSLCPVAGKIVNTRIQPDGTRVPFSIPPKQVLVITGVDW